MKPNLLLRLLLRLVRGDTERALLEVIDRHRDALWATDFLTAEVLTWGGLVTCYVLFFIHLGTRRVSSAA